MQIPPVGSRQLHGRTRAWMQGPSLAHNLFRSAMSDWKMNSQNHEFQNQQQLTAQNDFDSDAQ
eukprot:12138389-Karenia_brevis.AAC.1